MGKWVMALVQAATISPEAYEKVFDRGIDDVVADEYHYGMFIGSFAGLLYYFFSKCPRGAFEDAMADLLRSDPPLPAPRVQA
jgi:hypothetical protein